jgi:hypothetical protein
MLFGARDQIRTGDPHVGKEMLALISLRNFDGSDPIDAFRSIVGEGGRREAGDKYERREPSSAHQIRRSARRSRDVEFHLVTDSDAPSAQVNRRDVARQGWRIGNSSGVFRTTAN